MDNLVRYHAGIFGFTGVGKSNLISSLLRRAMKFDLYTVIFDVSREYAIHLLDMIDRSIFCSTERLDDLDALLASQTVPESIEDKLGDDLLKDKISSLNTIYEIALEASVITLQTMLRYEIVEKENIQARLALQEIESLKEIDIRKDLRELEKDQVISVLDKFYRSTS